MSTVRSLIYDLSMISIIFLPRPIRSHFHPWGDIKKTISPQNCMFTEKFHVPFFVCDLTVRLSSRVINLTLLVRQIGVDVIFFFRSPAIIARSPGVACKNRCSRSGRGFRLFRAPGPDST